MLFAVGRWYRCIVITKTDIIDSASAIQTTQMDHNNRVDLVVHNQLRNICFELLSVLQVA